MSATRDECDRIAAALAAPFADGEVKFKAQTVSGSRALPVPFVDARVIQDRLDEVLGVLNWQDSYEALPDGAAVCRLTIRLGDEWITKEDVGGQSEQPDGGDRRKASFSDALKRAAVKFGIGRYLYGQKLGWLDYDPHKKRFLQKPRLSVPARSRTPEQPPPPAPAQEQPAGPAEPPLTVRQFAEKFEKALLAEGTCIEGALIEVLGKDLGPRWDQLPKAHVREACLAFRAAQIDAIEEFSRTA